MFNLLHSRCCWLSAPLRAVHLHEDFLNFNASYLSRTRVCVYCCGCGCVRVYACAIEVHLCTHTIVAVAVAVTVAVACI